MSFGSPKRQRKAAPLPGTPPDTFGRTWNERCPHLPDATISFILRNMTDDDKANCSAALYTGLKLGDEQEDELLDALEEADDAMRKNVGEILTLTTDNDPVYFWMALHDMYHIMLFLLDGRLDETDYFANPNSTVSVDEKRALFKEYVQRMHQVCRPSHAPSKNAHSADTFDPDVSDFLTSKGIKPQTLTGLPGHVLKSADPDYVSTFFEGLMDHQAAILRSSYATLHNYMTEKFPSVVPPPHLHSIQNEVLKTVYAPIYSAYEEAKNMPLVGPLTQAVLNEVYAIDASLDFTRRQLFA